MKLVCPCCLGQMSAAETYLLCAACGSYPIKQGIPVMLVRDENWTKKLDEIAGEVEFNTKTVSESTHQKRNLFLNNNSLKLLLQTETYLAGKSVLVVGSSMAEVNCFAGLAGSMTALDIVADLAIMYRDACVQQGLKVEWVCGDGESLPFPDESYDVVIVRQALHHMLRYYSAISEFFRVTKVGGRILIIEEPYSDPDLDHPALAGMPDTFPLYDGVSLGALRRHLIWKGSAGARTDVDFSTAEQMKQYVAAIPGDAESLLADKYHHFSAAEMMVAIRMHTDFFKLIWPDEIGWARPEGNEIIFEHGPNSALQLPLIGRLSIPNTFSVVANKTRRTQVLRSREGLTPVGIA